MNLDLRTILVMLMVSAVLMAVTLTVGAKSGHSLGVAKWKLGLHLYALGWVLLASREILPPEIGVALGDSLLLAGLCFQIASLREFAGRRSSTVLIVAPALLLFVLILPLLQDYRVLTLVVSIAYSAALVTAAMVAIRLGEAAGRARWMLAGTCAAGSILLLVRAADVWMTPFTDLFASNDLHAIAFLVLFANIIVASTSFLLMHHERDESELTRLAAVDPLTGLFNRRAFMELAERELARLRRTRQPYAVLMMDLDFFKRVNDEYGHQAGDRVLAAFAAVAKSSVRSEDLVGRYGGEEFCAILPGAHLAKAAEVAERLRQAVALRPLGELPRATTVSIGAVECDATLTSLDAAIARADVALYRAKREGRNRVVALAMADDASQPPGLHDLSAAQ